MRENCREPSQKSEYSQPPVKEKKKVRFTKKEVFEYEIKQRR